MAFACTDAGDAEHASALREEALTLARQSGDHHAVGSILQTMGNLARVTGKLGPARELIGEGLNIMHRIGCQHCSARYLGDLAFVASASGQQERAVRLLGAADALRERTGIVVPPALLGKMQQMLAEARHGLGEPSFGAVWNEGRAMSLPQASAYATEPMAPVVSFA